MMAFKGTTKDMTATYGRGIFQYELGKKVTEEKSKTVSAGLHCAEYALDCLKWYPLSKDSRFFLVEAAGSIDEETSDSKIACTEMTLIRELTVKELAGYGMMYMVKYPKREWHVGSARLSLGEIAEGCGERSIAIARGKNPQVRGRTGSICGIVLEPENGNVTAARLFVAGRDAKADIWYTLDEDRELVEVEA